MFHGMKGAVVMLCFRLLLLAALISGCSGSDDQTAPAPTTTTTTAPALSPPQKCEAFLNTYCESAVSCLIKGGLVVEADRATANQQCVSGAEGQLPCARAASVTASYEQCETELKTLPCDPIIQLAQGSAGIDPLPASCRGVIQLAP